MLEYLASIGVRFGTNVNAFTSRNVTAYNISEVPLARETIIDTVLLMLHDWSSYITCDSAEIEAERGVIREEWRTRDIPPHAVIGTAESRDVQPLEVRKT